MNVLTSGTNGQPILPPTTAQVGEVIVEKPGPSNIPVPYCDPRNRIRYHSPYMFPPHVAIAQPGTSIQNHVNGGIDDFPTSSLPVPMSPMDHATTTPPPTTFAAFPSGKPPMWSVFPPFGTASHPSVPSTVPSIHPPMPPMPFHLGVPTPAPAMSHAQEELLGVSSRRLAREMMTR